MVLNILKWFISSATLTAQNLPSKAPEDMNLEHQVQSIYCFQITNYCVQHWVRILPCNHCVYIHWVMWSFNLSKQKSCRINSLLDVVISFSLTKWEGEDESFLNFLNVVLNQQSWATSETCLGKHELPVRVLDVSTWNLCRRCSPSMYLCQLWCNSGASTCSHCRCSLAH